MNRTIVMRFGMILALAGLCSGCAMFGRGNDRSELMSSAPVSEENRQQELRDLVRDVLSKELQADDLSSARMVEKRPYFFKEYVGYPNGIEGYDMSIVASDSKSTPYIATITLDKERHSTKLSKNRKDANADTAFYAAKGYEERTFELRHGRWRETGSVFITQEGDTVPRNRPLLTGTGGLNTTDDGGFLRRLMFWRGE